MIGGRTQPDDLVVDPAAGSFVVLYAARRVRTRIYRCVYVPDHGATAPDRDTAVVMVKHDYPEIQSTLPDTPSATSQGVDRTTVAASPIRCPGQIAPPAREKFLRVVAANLNGQAEVGDGRLDKLIRKLLEFYLERSVRLRAAMSRKNFRERGYDSDWTRLAREFKRA